MNQKITDTGYFPIKSVDLSGDGKMLLVVSGSTKVYKNINNKFELFQSYTSQYSHIYGFLSDDHQWLVLRTYQAQQIEIAQYDGQKYTSNQIFNYSSSSESLNNFVLAPDHMLIVASFKTSSNKYLRVFKHNGTKFN